MTAFQFLFGRSVANSVSALDRELKGYFRESVRFRSRARRGAIVIVDTSTILFYFLRDLVYNCNLKCRIVHVDDAKNARKALAELGQHDVKAVVINADLLFASANGVTLAEWVNREYPDIPVWISDCPPEKDSEVRKASRRVGILQRGTSLAEYVDLLGFPPHCAKHVENLKCGSDE